MFSLDELSFRYEPYPIGLACPLFPEDLYRELVATYPPVEQFERSRIGVKYVLSDRVRRSGYFQFLRATPAWQDFYRWVISDAFIVHLLDALAARGLELPYRQRAPVPRYLRHLAFGLLGRPDHRGSLRSRFEFSMLPADGGSVIPHTDAPGKVITLVLSMAGEGEWDTGIGGGTDVNVPKRAELIFNRMNDKAGFDDVAVVHTFPFVPNQAVVFLRTYNSWHSVRPMKAAGSALMRRTVTINVLEA
ncbi:MAG: hypothetical protein JSV45_00745 [Chromatiales bacterium]|nr:MAG: hypothetical protein JSV45_00745 [Chromatiales bacterium]